MASCSGWVEPLNLECILINTFAGTIELFILIAFIAIAAMGTRFRMMNTTLLIMFAIFGILMAQYMQGIYFLIILIGGLVIAFGIGRLAKV